MARYRVLEAGVELDDEIHDTNDEIELDDKTAEEHAEVLKKIEEA